MQIFDLGAGASVSRALCEVGLHGERPVLVAVGGAAGMSADAIGIAADFVTQIALPAVSAAGAAIVDGGTDSGIMRVLGRAYAEAGSTVPLVGVVVRALVGVGDDAGGIKLEPNHTHLALVPGSQWGDESPWIAEVATRLAGHHGSLTLVINGGAVTLQDVVHSLRTGRPVVVVAGTGRVADELAALVGGREADVPTEVGDAVRSGSVAVLKASESISARRDRLLRLLGRC